MQDRVAEDGDERIAGELLQRAAVPCDDRGDLAEVAREDPPDRLRVEPLAERRRARDVDEEDGDRPPRLDGERLGGVVRGDLRRAAGRAEACPVGRSLSTLVAEHCFRV